MAGSLTLALESARSGLLVNQAALNIVATNIANVNTPGYSRKIAEQEPRVIAGDGAGVKLSEITRKIDVGLLRSLRLQLTSFNQLDVQNSFYQRIQELFGAPADNSSIAHIAASLASAMELLAVSPEKTLEQGEVVRWGEEFASRLLDMTDTILELRRQADQSIADAVKEINELSVRIGELNDKIVRNSAVKLNVSDLRDERDRLVDRMAELIDIQYFTRNDGDINIYTTGGAAIVSSFANPLTHVQSSSLSPTFTHAEGDISGIYIGPEIAANDITNRIRGGRLKGLIDLRDVILPNLQSQIDELAAAMKDLVNQVHNRGVAFPGGQTFIGTRNFARPTVQTITLDPTSGADDVTITLMNSDGDQQAVTTLETIMTSASFGTAAQAANGPWTISEVAATMEDWLLANGAGSATVSVNSDGKFVIDLNSTTLFLGFRDEAATAFGSAHEDAVIGFDADGDGTIDETVNGFSYFFGLNDFFTDGLDDVIHESDVLANTFVATAATLTFTDSTGSLGSVAVSAGDSLSTIATNVNTASLGVTATVVPDGNGFRLRLTHDLGSNMTVTQAGGDTLLADIGMHLADVRTSSFLSVNSAIVAAPSRIASGALQWDADMGVVGEYISSISDNTTAEAMAEVLVAENTFKTAGGIAGFKASVSEFSSAIVSRNASEAAVNKRNLDFEQTLRNSLQLKSDNVRGVNLDEEMAQLILLEQAYAAAARLISVIQSMFDALTNAVR